MLHGIEKLNKHYTLIPVVLDKNIANHDLYCIFRSMNFHPVETISGRKSKSHKTENILVQLCAW